MSSALGVTTVKNTSNQTLLTNGYPNRPGRIVEYLSNLCDGSTVTGQSGTYTWPSVTAQQAWSTSYQTITGSNLAYTPPSGTTRVQYRFQFSSYWGAAHAINHYKFYIDAAEVVYARHNRSFYYEEDRTTFEWTVYISGATDTNKGTLTSWTTPKTLSMQFRGYGASDFCNLHGTTYWDGVSSNQFSMPMLSIIALA